MCAIVRANGISLLLVLILLRTRYHDSFLMGAPAENISLIINPPTGWITSKSFIKFWNWYNIFERGIKLKSCYYTTIRSVISSSLLYLNNGSHLDWKLPSHDWTGSFASKTITSGLDNTGIYQFSRNEGDQKTRVKKEILRVMNEFSLSCRN